MKQRSGRYIGINQRVPFAVLDTGLATVIKNGSVDKSELRHHMLEFTKGANRADKAAAYAKAILSRPADLIAAICAMMTADDYHRVPTQERKILILSLLAVTYPITYDLLAGMARAFKVQPYLSTSAIHQILGKLYGSNRTLAIAIDALLPMLIEFEILKRSKTSIYELMPAKSPVTAVVNEAWIYADLKASGEKAILPGDLMTRAWYHFVSVTIPKKSSLLRFPIAAASDGHIILKKEGAVANG